MTEKELKLFTKPNPEAYKRFKKKSMEKIFKTVRLFFQAHMESSVSRNPLDMCSWWLFVIAYSIFSESELNILPAQTAVGYPP